MERAVEFLLKAVALLSILVIGLIFLFLFKESLPVLTKVPLSDFFTNKIWAPTDTPPKFSLLPLLAGSFLVTLGALVIAVPLGLAAAIYLGQIAHPTIRGILKPAIEVLAGIPSVVYGFFALMVLAPKIKSLFHLDTGLTALTGSIILAIMALPTIVSVSEDAINAVPRRYAEASLSLGATRWQTIKHVIVPAAFSGITAAVMLGMGRAIGETMAVMMATGNAAVIPNGFLVPVRTMTATIAAEMGEVPRGSEHYHALFLIGLVLMIITLVINLIADYVARKVKEVE